MSATTKEGTIEMGLQIIDLIHGRIEEGHRLPDGAVRVASPPKDERYFIESVMLCGTVDAVRVRRTTGNYFYLEFGNPNHAAYRIEIVGRSTPDVTFEGPDEQRPKLAEQIEKVRSLPIGLNELVPYGWVANGNVVAVVYSDGIKEMPNDSSVLTHGIGCYVLQGERLPDELRIHKGDAAWSSRMWSFIQQGKLVRLSTRINAMSQEVSAVFDGANLPSITFSDDGYWPSAFVPKQPYVAWSLKDQTPGEGFDPKSHNGGEPYKRVLTGWFR